MIAAEIERHLEPLEQFESIRRQVVRAALRPILRQPLTREFSRTSGA